MDNAGQRESGEFPASNLVSTESRPWEQDFLSASRLVNKCDIEYE